MKYINNSNNKLFVELVIEYMTIFSIANFKKLAKLMGKKHPNRAYMFLKQKFEGKALASWQDVSILAEKLNIKINISWEYRPDKVK